MCLPMEMWSYGVMFKDSMKLSGLANVATSGGYPHNHESKGVRVRACQREREREGERDFGSYICAIGVHCGLKYIHSLWPGLDFQCNYTWVKTNTVILFPAQPPLSNSHLKTPQGVPKPGVSIYPPFPVNSYSCFPVIRKTNVAISNLGNN